MTAFFALLFFGLSGGLALYFQASARGQRSVLSPLSGAEADTAVRNTYRLWRVGGGGGEYRFVPRLRRDPPEVGVRLTPAEGGTEVDVWLAGYHSILGFANHAFLVWRKRRALLRRLAGPDGAGGPDKELLGIGAVAVAIVLCGFATTVSSAADSGSDGQGSSGSSHGVAEPTGGQPEATADPSSGPTADPALPTPQIETPTLPTLPDGAVQCPRRFNDQGALLQHSARGNNVTTCPFAENVRKAYLDEGSSAVRVEVHAYSPVTKKHYDMTCNGTALVRCTGGRNALVLIY